MEYSTTKKYWYNMKKEPIAEEVKEVLGNAELTDKQGLFYISYIKRFKEIRAWSIEIKEN